VSGNTNAPWKNEELLRQKYCAEGLTIQELADKWDTSFSTIRYYKDKYNIEGRPNGISPKALNATDEDLWRLYWDEGLSVIELADELDTSESWVVREMEKRSIPRETPDQEKGTEWKDAERLERLYWDEGLTLEEIGNELGCSASTVAGWMERFNIDREKIPEEKPPLHRWNRQGYEEVKTKVDGTSYSVRIHRLIAVAHGMLEPSEFRESEIHIHHKNGVRWDNRPDNLERKTKSEHHTHHYKERETNDKGRFIG